MKLIFPQRSDNVSLEIAFDLIKKQLKGVISPFSNIQNLVYEIRLNFILITQRISEQITKQRQIENNLNMTGHV